MLPEQQRPIWPFVAFLIGLLVLSAASPEIWEKLAHRRPPLEAARAQRRDPADATPAAVNEGRRDNSRTPASANPIRLVRVPAPANKALAAETGVAAPASATSSRGSEPLSEAAAPAGPQLVSPFPAVGSQPIAPEAGGEALPDSEPAAPQLLPPATTSGPSEPEPTAAVARIPARVPDSPETKPGPAPAPRLSEPKAPEPAPTWHEPVVLLDHLGMLIEECDAGEWALEVDRCVRKLLRAGNAGSAEVGEAIGELRSLAHDAGELEAGLDDGALAAEVRQTAQALRRRLDIWEQMIAIAGPALIDTPPAEPDPQQVALCLSQIDKLTQGSPEGVQWRQFVMLEALRELPAQADARRRDLAGELLDRFASPRLTPVQREVLDEDPFATLRHQLLRIQGETPNLSDVLRHLECYEETGRAGYARLVAEDRRMLACSSSADEQELARRIDEHYSNPNLRVAISERMLNRLVPEQEPRNGVVRDTVLGIPVYGRSVTLTDLTVKLVPDPERIRLELHATGQVLSSTVTSKGPFTFYNAGNGAYVAVKPLELTLDGFRVGPAQPYVRNHVRLRGLETDLDVIPLVGSLLRDVGRMQHQQNQPDARREIEWKLAKQVRETTDREADERFRVASDKLRQRVLAPLYRLGVAPTMVHAETTTQRIAMLLRLAGEDQMAACTVRPWAPSDSLASLQIHESALNNMIQKLNLDGRTFTLAELQQHLADTIGRDDLCHVEPEHKAARITFVRHDALRVRCVDDRVAVILTVAELENEGTSWRNFRVRAFYHPQLDGMATRLVRDDILYLDGRLSLGSQIALRGIFGKIFSESRPLQVIPDRLRDDPNMADLEVTQFAITDGWIAVAIGPKRTSQLASRPQ